MNILKLNELPTKQINILKQKNLTIDKELEEPISPSEKLHKDEVCISDKAKKLLERHKEFIEDRKEFLEELANLPEYAPDPQILCMQIAMRIISGDKVPDKDRRFLAENDPGMYSKALLLQRQNDDPKKHKSILPEEDEDDGITDIATSVSTEDVVVSESTESSPID